MDARLDDGGHLGLLLDELLAGLLDVVEAVLVGGDLRLERLVARPLGVHRLGAAVRLVLGDDVLLLDPLGQLLAVLHELLQLERVAQALHELGGALAVRLAPLADALRLALGLVRGEVALVGEPLREQHHVVHLVVVRVHRREEGLVPLDGVLGLLQVGRHLVLH